MTTISSQITGLATLALAMLPAAALTTAARAETAPAAHVRIADLDLATTPGKAVFARRVNQAAGEFCSDRSDISFRLACVSAFHREARERLAAAQQSQIQLARN